MKDYISALNNVIWKPLTMRQTPVHIQLEPTTYCNLNCKMCGRSQYLDTSRHLAPKEFRRILDQIHPRKITFSGLGEPFTHPQLLDMVKLAKEYGASINTTTNCTLLNPTICEQMVRSGLDLIKISIDGATRETYQRIRGEDRFLEVLDGIRTLAEAKKRLESGKPFIRLNYVISKENYHEVANTVELAYKLEVDAVYFQPLELIGIEARQKTLVGDLTYEAFSQTIRIAIQTAKRFGVNTNLKGILHRLPSYWRKYQLNISQQDNGICILPWFSAYITVDGFVRPCCSFSQTETNMGNILMSAITDIWNGKRYQQFRKAIRKGKRPYPICANCVPQRLIDVVQASNVLPGFLR